MAQLELAPGGWNSQQTRAQYAAIAWLRWRIFINQFRRKGGTGELVAQIITYPIAACLALAPVIGAGALAWYFASNGRLDHLSWVLWVTFALCQFLNIQLGQPGTTFDPTQLIRFPVSVGSYIAIRLFFGLLAPSNIIVTLMSLAMALGVTIAQPQLWIYSFVAMIVFAATNILFTRMVFAWVDRWLSTRRAREIFTALIFTFSLGIQWVNVTFNPAYNHPRHHSHSAGEDAGSTQIQARLDKANTYYARVHPFLAALPPELTASSLIASSEGHPLEFSGDTLGCACFALVFLYVFGVRTRTEFRGENFSDVANAVAAPVRSATSISHFGAATLAPATPQRSSFGISPVVAGLMGKELLTLRRNTGLLYGLIAPVVMVFLFAGKLGMGHGGSIYLFPAALAYAMMGIAPMAYNSFGMEGAGVQFYFIAPVSLRDIFLSKNLMSFLLASVEVTAVLFIIIYLAGVPPLEVLVGSLLWGTAALLISLTLGNRRSITAPKKIDLGRTASKQASPLSALMSIGVLLAFAAFGTGILLLGSWFNILWIMPPVMGLLAAVAVVIYRRNLAGLDAFTLAHRDQLFEELCKN